MADGYLKVDELLKENGGCLLQEGPGFFSGISVDSREVQLGNVFFCLKGNRVDGYLFAGQAAKKGANVIIISKERDIPQGCENVSVIGVLNPFEALLDFARIYRKKLSCPIVGVTGSNGKTTTKEMIAAILSKASGGPEFILKSEGNKNTDIGLALTLSHASLERRFAVFEMAMRTKGEIRRLAEIVQPVVGVITNIGPAHLELLGSLDNIASAKGELFEALPKDGRAVYPFEETSRFKEMISHIRAENHWTVGTSTEAKVRILNFETRGLATKVCLRCEGREIHFTLPFTGHHNVKNAACAAAVALALGVASEFIQQGLEETVLPGGRSHICELGGRWIMDDCYNANPASMTAALETLAQLAHGQRAYAVLGDMLELGAESAAYHWKIGQYLARLGIYGLVGVGELSREMVKGAREGGCPRIYETTDPHEAAGRISSWSNQGDWILIKASRGMQLERVIEELKFLWELKLSK